MSQFNLDNLQTFYWCVKLGSLNAAAEHLNKSQPTISSHIKQLEAYYETELFSRTRAGVKLTHQGQIIFTTIEKPMEELCHSKDVTSLNEPKGPLNILTFVGLGSQWLVRFLDGFLEQYPQININLDLKDMSRSSDINFDLYDVIIGPYQYDRPNIIQHELLTSTINLYASKAYIEKHGRPKNIEDLSNHKVLANYTSRFHDTKMTPHDWVFFSQKETKIKPYLSINSTTALARLCAEGVGIAPIVDYQKEVIIHQLEQILPDVESKTILHHYSFKENMRNVKRVTVLYDYLMKKKEENPKSFVQAYSK